MNKYKVEIMRTERFIVDVEAKDEKEAKTLASKEFSETVNIGMEHYHQTDEAETDIYAVYDVTNTDDPFNPVK